MIEKIITNGFILHLMVLSSECIFLKEATGAKKSRFIETIQENLLIMYHEKGYQCYHFDCDADCYPDLDINGL